MTQQVSDPPEQAAPPPALHSHSRLSRAGILSLLILIGVLLVLFSGQIVFGLVQVDRLARGAKATPTSVQAGSTTQAARSASPNTATLPTPTPAPDQTAATDSPFFTPDNPAAPSLELAGGRYVVYQARTHIYVVASDGDAPQALSTPGYVYNEAVSPILTPDGQLIYTGNGIWLTDIFGSVPVQLATLDQNKVITSLALSNDGKMIAWSTEPADGTGTIDIHAGPLANPTVVYTQSALECPCFRIFSFMNGKSAQADDTLLLTDDRGSNEAVQYGLWSLDFTSILALPQMILREDPQQGPLTLTPGVNTLVYSTSEGAVPVPTDGSIPADIAALSYANSLSVTTLNGAPLTASRSQIILPEQHNLTNTAQYHWVTTPTFAPDGHTLAYVEFSSDAQDPYDRHNALYTVQISGSGARLSVSTPKLIATSTTDMLETGVWLDGHTLTMYGDGALYAIDIQSNALIKLAQVGEYARVIAVVG